MIGVGCCGGGEDGREGVNLSLLAKQNLYLPRSSLVSFISP